MELESRFTAPRTDCPHPERWHSPDPDSTEYEVSMLVGAFVRALRPDLAVETGTAFGQTARMMGEALAEHGGSLLTYEVDDVRVAASRNLCHGLPVEVVMGDSRTGLDLLRGQIEAGARPRVGFAWLDSLFELRVLELAAVAPLLTKGAIVGIHDCGEPGATKYSGFATEVATAAKRLGFARISLPTPRGVTFLQWKG